MRATLTTLAEIAGLGLVAFGCWLVFPPAGFVVAGAALVLIGVRQA